MPRPKSTWPPKPKTHHDSMRVWWNGKWHHLGPASDEAVWKKELGRLIELWRTDPGAESLDAHELLIAELYRDYMASADAPTEARQRGLASTALDLLNERYGDKPVAEFTVGDLEDWMRWLARLPPIKPSFPHPTRFNITTVKHLAGFVQRAWRWAVRKRGLPDRELLAGRQRVGGPRLQVAASCEGTPHG